MTTALPRPALFRHTAARARQRLRWLWLRELAKVDIIVEQIFAPFEGRVRL